MFEWLLTLGCLCVHRAWLTWAKAHWHSVLTIVTGSWWARLLLLDYSPCWFPSSMSRTVSLFTSWCIISATNFHTLTLVHCDQNFGSVIDLSVYIAASSCVHYSNPGKIPLHTVWPGSSHAATYAGHIRWGAEATARVCQSWTGEAFSTWNGI